MATNPMQRKTRNSFLLGMLVTLLIAGAVIAVLIMLLMNKEKEQEALQTTMAYVASKDIASGAEVTIDDLTPVQIPSGAAASNLVGADSFSDKEGKNITARINLTKGTVVTADMLYKDGDEAGNDVRKQEYNTVILPIDLETGDYIDIRLLLPSGQDYIVVSKKKVEIPVIGGVDSADTIWVQMTEDEILTMSNAIVEAYMINGSKLYATKYTEPGNQEAAKPTYPINGEVAKLVLSDGNIVEEAKSALSQRYNKELREDYINSAISSQEDAKGNQQSGMEESITNSQTSRQEYLDSLMGTTE